MYRATTLSLTLTTAVTSQAEVSEQVGGER